MHEWMKDYKLKEYYFPIKIRFATLYIYDVEVRDVNKSRSRKFDFLQSTKCEQQWMLESHNSISLYYYVTWI